MRKGHRTLSDEDIAAFTDRILDIVDRILPDPGRKFESGLSQLLGEVVQRLYRIAKTIKIGAKELARFGQEAKE